VDPNSIVGLFQQGKGIMALCNVAVVTATTTMNPAGATIAASANGTMALNGPPTTVVLSAVGGTSSAPASVITSVITSRGSIMTLTMSGTAVNYAQSMTISTATSVPAAQQVSNPSRPTCTPGGQNQGNSGSPFDSFNDQLCSGSVASTLGLSKRIGSFLGVVAMALVWG
jgi:hypothetical protein